MKKYLLLIASVVFCILLLCLFILPPGASAFTTDRGMYTWLTGEDRQFSWYDANGSPVDVEFWATSPEDLSGLAVLKACYMVPPYGMLCDALGQTFQFKIRSGDIVVEGFLLTVTHNGDLRVVRPDIDTIYLYDGMEGASDDQ